jgi:hypothetical protein
MKDKKYWIIILVIAIGAYLFGYLNNKRTGSTQSAPTPTLSASSVPTITSNASTGQQITENAGTVVRVYYDWYFSCINECVNAGCDNTEVCSYNKPGTLTDSLNNLLLKPKGYDQVLCAQDVPASVSYDNAVTGKDGTATDSVHLHWDWGTNGKETTTINVGLQLVSNQWKISSITCPAP